MKQIYFDRWGKQYIKSTETPIHHRKGVWFILIHNDKILFIHPTHAPLVPDLPGGGIEDGENLYKAACRELYEETELNVSSLKIENEYKQNVQFFAEHDQEYWNYEQSFLLVSQKLEDLYFEKRKPVSEGFCEWINIKNLNQHQINYMHKKALYALNLIGDLN